MIINTPNHKRWLLPDGRHYYNSVIFGDVEHISVIDSVSYETRQSVYLKMDKNWEENSALAQELARKRYKNRTIKGSLPRELERLR